MRTYASTIELAIVTFFDLYPRLLVSLAACTNLERANEAKAIAVAP